MNLIAQILSDMRVELSDEFDKNFSNGAFFSQTWKQKADGSKSNLIQSGKLRRSISARVTSNAVVFSSSEPYAAIHNTGGKIKVTARMRRFFWAKYYEAGGGTKTAKRASKQAELYKALALKKIGSEIVIPERKFVGNHTSIRKRIEEITFKCIQEAVNKTIQSAKK